MSVQQDPGSCASMRACSSPLRSTPSASPSFWKSSNVYTGTVRFAYCAGTHSTLYTTSALSSGSLLRICANLASCFSPSHTTTDASECLLTYRHASGPLVV